MDVSALNVESQAKRLISILRGYRRVAVAFSAGVDSTVVAKAAQMALGENAVAITASSPSLAIGELDQARDLAAQIGIQHRVIQTQEFASAGYQRNAGDRCYYCKSELYDRILELNLLEEPTVLCNGANLNDLGDYRPGLQAAQERQVRSPLIEAGLTKADVRNLARYWNLPIWDKPASPCLSSRIAYGVEVNAQRVQRIDAAESYLREKFQLRTLRVRLEANDLARIEVPVEAIALLADNDARTEVTRHLRTLGFRYITLDLEGFRSGSLNEALPLVNLSSLSSD